MKIFLAGSFHTVEQEERLRRIYDTLEDNNYDVFWAPEEVERGYELDDYQTMEENFEIELEAILDSDVLLAVMERGTIGTSIELGLPKVVDFIYSKTADSLNIDMDIDTPYVLCYTVPGSEGDTHPDFESSSFEVVVDDVVKDPESILDVLYEYELESEEQIEL